MAGKKLKAKEDAVRQPRALLVDGHPLMAAALTGLLAAENCLVVGCVASAAEARSAVQRQPPDLLVLELQLGPEDGVELIKFCLAQHPTMRVLVFSQADEIIFAERCVRAGAAAYVMKSEPPDVLQQAIRTAMAGHVHVSPRVAAALFSSPPTARRGVASDLPLTDRQLHVFRLLGERLSVREIARALGVSPKTVETHCAQMKVKLNLRDLAALRTRAVSWHGRER